MKLLLLLAASVTACPLFVEFFPDPVDIGDKEGEFVEVRLDSSFAADSIFFSVDAKAAFAVPYPEGSRLVLVHDSAYCPSKDDVACAVMAVSLPNSRESAWKLDAGTCLDSALLPTPKAGKAFQRRGETDDWVLAVATPGYANADYESGIRDCGLASVRIRQEGADSSVGRVFHVEGWLTGCPGADLRVRSQDLSAGVWHEESMEVGESFRLELMARGSLWLHLALPDDEYPLNNVLDTLLLVEGRSPLVVSEVHHCPPEPVPEWVEVYNASRSPFPLSQLHLCGRGGTWGGTLDSISPLQAILVTKDSAELRAHLGFADVRIVQASIGYLNNTGGSLSLCLGSQVVDSVSWSKGTASCPDGFSPLAGAPENTPGFVPKAGSRAEDPFTMTLSSRVVRTKGTPLRVRVEARDDVALRLLDSAGREIWKGIAPAGSSVWIEVPVRERARKGVNYVAARLGDFEKVVGIVLRP
jgi:hypothetical protein